MQILFGMPEDRRKCIPSMVTIMEISVYPEITKGQIEAVLKPFTTQIFQRGERLFCCPYIYR